MEIRTGCDIVYIPRFEIKMKDQPAVLKKLFSPAELADSRPEHLAGLFAAKEAVLKAIGFQPDAWLDLEIQKRTTGEPIAVLGDSLASRVSSIHISISHDRDYAMAIAVATLK